MEELKDATKEDFFFVFDAFWKYVSDEGRDIAKELNIPYSTLQSYIQLERSPRKEQKRTRIVNAIIRRFNKKEEAKEKEKNDFENQIHNTRA